MLDRTTRIVVKTETDNQKGNHNYDIGCKNKGDSYPCHMKI